MMLTACGGGSPAPVGTPVASPALSAPTPQPVETKKVGQSFPLASPTVMMDVTLVSIKGYKRGTEPLAPPPRNGRMVVADVLVDVHSGSFSFYAGMFCLQLTDARTYDGYPPGPDGFDPGFSPGQVGAGERKRGYVGFDVATTKAELFQMTADGQVVAQWAVSV